MGHGFMDAGTNASSNWRESPGLTFVVQQRPGALRAARAEREVPIPRVDRSETQRAIVS